MKEDNSQTPKPRDDEQNRSEPTRDEDRDGSDTTSAYRFKDFASI